jgi:hypothetical protein
MNMQQQTVDIGQIMTEIQREIETKGLRNTVLPFVEIHTSSFADMVMEMERFRRIYAYRELNSRRGLPGKIILFFKKAIRKMSKFYIEPIVEDQNNFNFMVVQGMDKTDQQTAVWRAIRDLRAENDALKKQIEQLESKLPEAEG